MSGRLRSPLVYACVAIVGLVAFGWPFLASVGSTSVAAHSGDAWLWAAVLALLVGLILALEARQHGIPGIHLALLGVLSAFIAVVRLLDLPGGGNAMFFVVILAAAAFGPRFAVSLSLVAMAASAVATGGVGPWLPFQMLALAAIAVPAAWLGRVTQRWSPRAEVAALAAAAWMGAFLYGALMNLWSWPLVQDGGALSYEPGLGPAATAARYWSFYVSTSFAWDAAGALANAVLVVAVGIPLLRVFRAVGGRMEPRVDWGAPAGALSA